MNRKLAVVVGLAVLGGALYLGGRLTAQQQYPAGTVQTMPPAVSKIAVVNLGQVIKNYSKFKNFMTDFQAKDLAARKQLEAVQTEAVKLKAEQAKPETSATRQQEIEKRMRDIQRQVQDFSEETGARLGKEQFDMLVAVYKEIDEAVKVYAQAKNLEMVLHYNDAVGQDLYLPEVFRRRLQNNACLPMYTHPSLDISNQITEMLNRRVQAPAPTGQPVQR